MLLLQNDLLEFRFPEVHEEANVSIDLQRTLRIPDDGREYPLPAGLGRFPMRHVDDFRSSVPADWNKRGGVMVPMWQAEALWLNFTGRYPCAIKIAAGKRSAVTGEAWQEGLTSDPQDYVVVPDQPWLDGFCLEKGTIRQFVAMPLGKGYSVEEQLTGKAEFGGLQIEVFPMKRDIYEKHFPPQPEEDPFSESLVEHLCSKVLSSGPDMGLGAGGRMRQQIYEDPFDFEDWDLAQGQRCFIHLCNSEMWQAYTGERPPTTPPTAHLYAAAGLPWFDYYADGPALAGGEGLQGVKSVKDLGAEKGEVPLPENESMVPQVTIGIGRKDDQVRVGEF